MCDAGRIRHHLKQWLWNSRATVLLVGFQSNGTLGRFLQDGAKAVRIQGDEIKVAARIRMIDDYSGHADGSELARWSAARRPIRRGVFLVHGEEKAIAGRNALALGARWSDAADSLPDISNLAKELQQLRSETSVVGTAGQSEPAPPAAKRISAEYARSYLSHGTIGPSCAVALLKDGHMTVWSHTQGAFPLRSDLAKVLGMRNA
jgi:metallo-beta-lactamase family protein